MALRKIIAVGTIAAFCMTTAFEVGYRKGSEYMLGLFEKAFYASCRARGGEFYGQGSHSAHSNMHRHYVPVPVPAKTEAQRKERAKLGLKSDATGEDIRRAAPPKGYHILYQSLNTLNRSGFTKG